MSSGTDSGAPVDAAVRRAVAAFVRTAAAEVAVEEALAFDEATGTISLGYAGLILTAWRGIRYDELRATLLQRTGRSGLLTEPYATVVVRNGLGDYEGALEAGGVALEQRGACNHVALSAFGPVAAEH